MQDSTTKCTTTPATAALWLGLLWSVTGASVAEAGQCQASSSPTRTALVELYTSEGCSSCPPADRWLSALPGKTDGRVVPLAFHVDYWDYIGWPDRFARAEHTARQRQVARRNRLNTIYTPQVVVNGRDFRHWRWPGSFKATLETIHRQPAGAAIKFTLTGDDTNRITARGHVMLRPGTPPGQAEVFIALYQNRQVTRVGAGENHGRTLRHDAIVRQMFGPLTLDTNGDRDFRQDFYLNPKWKRSDLGVAVFVQDAASGDVLQAMSLDLC